MTTKQAELAQIVRGTFELLTRMEAVLHELARGNAHAQGLAWDVTRAVHGLHKDLQRSELYRQAVTQPATMPDTAERASAGSAAVVATGTQEPGDVGSTPTCLPNHGGPT